MLLVCFRNSVPITLLTRNRTKSSLTEGSLHESVDKRERLYQDNADQEVWRDRNYAKSAFLFVAATVEQAGMARLRFEATKNEERVEGIYED